MWEKSFESRQVLISTYEFLWSGPISGVMVVTTTCRFGR